MSPKKPITTDPVKSLQWRILGGSSDWYSPSWGGFGNTLIRDDFSRLYLIRRGGAVVKTEDREYQLEAGQFYIIPAGTSAYYSCPEGMHLSWLHFNIFIVPGVDLIRESCELSSVEAPPSSFSSFTMMLENLKAGSPAGLTRACGIAARFVAPFLRSDWSEILDTETRSPRIRSVIRYIHANLAADLTLSKLASVANVHPVYLSRLFKRITGTPPAKYVTAARMNHASDQLRLTGKRISEIGAESGFDDPYHFSRAFKQFVGVAPRDYREARALT